MKLYIISEIYLFSPKKFICMMWFKLLSDKVNLVSYESVISHFIFQQCPFMVVTNVLYDKIVINQHKPC